MDLAELCRARACNPSAPVSFHSGAVVAPLERRPCSAWAPEHTPELDGSERGWTLREWDSARSPAGTGVLCVMVLTLTEVFHIFGSDDPIDALSHHERICLGLWVGWVMPLAVLLFYTVFRAAAITEQCNRVPALVNSWVFEERELDREKQHVVQHIMHSFAGFYVKGIRLNASVAFKMSYLSGMLLFTFFTQRLLKST